MVKRAIPNVIPPENKKTNKYIKWLWGFLDLIINLYSFTKQKLFIYFCKKIILITMKKYIHTFYYKIVFASLVLWPLNKPIVLQKQNNLQTYIYFCFVLGKLSSNCFHFHSKRVYIRTDFGFSSPMIRSVGGKLNGYVSTY